MSGNALATGTIAVVFNPENPNDRFQAIAYGAYERDEASPRVIFSCPTQGQMTSWLATHGYRWIEGSQDPQQWQKV